MMKPITENMFSVERQASIARREPTEAAGRRSANGSVAKDLPRPP